MRSLIKFFAFPTLLFSLYGCEDEAITPDKMKSGAELYEYYCKACHEKQGPGAMLENYAGREAMTEHKVILLIKYGYNPRHNMPAFQSFSDQQADMLATYVVGLQTAHQNSRNP